VSRWSGLGGAWPTDSQELLLLAALSEPDAALEAWRRWRAANDLDRADADSQRLLPLVYRNLSAAGLRVADEARLKGVYRAWWYRNQLFLRLAGEALQTLHAAGLRTMLLKGAALCVDYYDDMGARPMADLDVMVPPQSAATAMALLDAEGWRTGPGWRAGSPEAADAVRLLHGESFHRGDVNFDLHWHVLRQPLEREDFWEHSIPAELGPHSTRVLCAADQIVNACDHGADPARTPIRWAADVATVVHSGHVDWHRLVDVARRQRLAATLSEFLTYAREVLGAPVPGEALARLRELGASRRERRAHRLMTRPANPARAVAIEWERYRRLAHYERRRLRPLRFPGYMRRTMGFPTQRELVVHGARRAWAVVSRRGRVQDRHDR
jgi:Uncharacterised nucleotidyltransferase